jgi:hypothetical protein
VSEVATIYIETETHRAVDFTCECGRIDCSETMMMTIAEYEAIRAHSTHFGVVPQHEQPETRASSSGTRATSSSRSASRTLRRLRAKQIRVRNSRRWSPRARERGLRDAAG